MSKIKIDKKIVSYSVKKPDDKNAEAPRPEYRRETTAGGAEVIRMHEKFGFRREGYFRSHVKKDGQHLDVVALGLLRSEWKLLKAGLYAHVYARS